MLHKASMGMFAAVVFAIAFTQVAGATGLATCDSGSPDGWKAKEELTEMLQAKGWKVRNVKVDGGCYEVYALDAKGERVEAYFHPVTLERVPIKGE